MSAEARPSKKPRRAQPTSIEDVMLEQEQQQQTSQKQNKQSKGAGYTLTVKEISTDKLTRIANAYWSSSLVASGKAPAFNPELIVDIYNSELGGNSPQPPQLKRVMLLEVSQYLENYLWPHFDESSATFEHVMTIVLMVNEKFRNGVPAWTCFHTRQDAVPGFFKALLSLKQKRESPEGGEGTPLQLHERSAYLAFTVNMFMSLEDELVRGQVLRLVSLPLWHALSSGRLQVELHGLPQLAKHWKSLLKKDQKASKQPGYVPPLQRPDIAFIPSLLEEFLATLDTVVHVPDTDMADGNGEGQAANGSAAPQLLPGPLAYCERFVTLLVDLLSQLPTRRFVRTLLDDRAILIKSKMCDLYKHPQATLYRQLVDLLQFYMGFPINDHTGDPLTDDEVTAAQYEKVCQLQRLFFKHWPQLKDLALANCGTVERRDLLKKALQALTPEQLYLLVVKQLRLVAEDDPWAQDTAFLLEVMLSTYERRRSQREVINEIPLYPTENILWDEGQIPSVSYTGEGCLALPKLNLQFLTPHDYLLRNFHLFRLEATYEIREDIADVLGRVGAYWDDVVDPPAVKFAGWARMALPLQTFRVTEVRKPAVGDLKPAAVTADVIISTRGLRQDVRQEWDQLKQHDVLFLLTIRPPSEAELGEMSEGGRKLSAAEKYGLVYVRGCEVIEIKDEGGKLMNDFTGRVKRDESKPPEGTTRTLTVALDTAQYQLDVNYLAKNKEAEDVYGTFNVIMRRKPKENNFKAVLESIRDLMNEAVIIPPWLHDIFLGYGDPGAAQWHALPKEQQLKTVDFKDTFLDADHLRDSFPNHQVSFRPAPGQESALPPYRITFPDVESEEGAAGKDKDADTEMAVAAGSADKKGLVVESYLPPDPGPYPQNQPPTNKVRFTPVQVEAITSGVQPGLTMVVGPPGTGKTDTAVQIMHVLYHNQPGQRTLVIAHSNQALNDLFTKILERDVPARYLLRLGMGEQELEVSDDFSRVGRVNSMLARRLELLAQVEKLARQFGVTEDVAYTCETAGYFWLLHVLSRWEKFTASVDKMRTSEAVKLLFPFNEFFADAPQPLFKGQTYEEDMERARGCFRHLKTLFQELEECRSFELLKGQADRVDYLMTKQAKIVAMTCTHAALKRREFLDLAFKYDNLLMEEAGQILEIETFIPMLLQRNQDDQVRLKRVILIGDHHQLPPVVQNMAIQKYAHLDQPLFTRFIRLGTPFVQLNAQGRARPTLARLYSWRYNQLGDLPNVKTQPEFLRANPALAFDYQFINVPDFMGHGETESSPYYYQNLGEAEYVVALYSYMRLLGYPADKISILTTYNGQKDLIKDVVKRRCGGHPLLGYPAKIATVDKYQGQQNDYILLSLVRTRVVGHLRDVRRLVVAMSRARLGLYVFGRQDLFGNCYELRQTFKQLLARPTQLATVKGENYVTCNRKASDKVPYDLQPDASAFMGLVDRIRAEQEAVRGVGGFGMQRMGMGQRLMLGGAMEPPPPGVADAAAASQGAGPRPPGIPPPQPPPGVPPPRPPPGVPPPRPPPSEPPTSTTPQAEGQAEAQEDAAQQGLEQKQSTDAEQAEAVQQDASGSEGQGQKGEGDVGDGKDKASGPTGYGEQAADKANGSS